MTYGRITGTLTLLAGAAIGAAAGVLLAPEKGKEMRRKVYSGAKSMAERIRGKVNKEIDEINEMKEGKLRKETGPGY